jgi:uncharacterized protein with PIN domain
MNLCFFVDEMLFYVAEYLRIMGYDTIYLKGLDDKEIIKMLINSKKSKKMAVLITGDKNLASVAKNQLVDVFYMYPEKKLFQSYLKDLINKYKLKIKKTTRCPKCNSVLLSKRKNELNKNELKQAKEVIKRYKVFFICKACKKVYWRGSQWKEMIKKIKSLF